DPPLVHDEAAAGGDHRAPFRRGRLGAETEEAKPGSGEDDTGHVEGDAHDHRGGAERDHVAEQDAGRGSALKAYGMDEVAVADGHGLSAGETGIRRPDGDRNGNDGV